MESAPRPLQIDAEEFGLLQRRIGAYVQRRVPTRAVEEIVDSSVCCAVGLWTQGRCASHVHLVHLTLRIAHHSCAHWHRQQRRRHESPLSDRGRAMVAIAYGQPRDPEDLRDRLRALLPRLEAQGLPVGQQTVLRLVVSGEATSCAALRRRLKLSCKDLNQILCALAKRIGGLAQDESDLFRPGESVRGRQ